MTEHKLAPQGRAFAFELPEDFVSDECELFVASGTIFCHNRASGLVYPLESNCRKVEIPGVKYRSDGT